MELRPYVTGQARILAGSVCLYVHGTFMDGLWVSGTWAFYSPTLDKSRDCSLHKMGREEPGRSCDALWF